MHGHRLSQSPYRKDNERLAKGTRTGEGYQVPYLFVLRLVQPLLSESEAGHSFLCEYPQGRYIRKYIRSLLTNGTVVAAAFG